MVPQQVGEGWVQVWNAIVYCNGHCCKIFPLGLHPPWKSLKTAVSAGKSLNFNANFYSLGRTPKKKECT